MKKRVKWQLTETTEDEKTYRFEIDKRNAFIIIYSNWNDSHDKQYCDTYLNNWHLGEYSSLRSAKKGVETLIKNIIKAWEDCNRE